MLKATIDGRLDLDDMLLSNPTRIFRVLKTPAIAMGAERYAFLAMQSNGDLYASDALTRVRHAWPRATCVHTYTCKPHAKMSKLVDLKWTGAAVQICKTMCACLTQ